MNINERIVKIWNDFPDSHNGRAPLFYGDFSEKEFLSIGLNPSFSKERFLNNAIKEVTGDSIDAEEFFKWDDVKKHLDEFIKKSLEIDEMAKNSKGNKSKAYAFYRPLIKITDEIGFKGNYEFVDMFLLRETDHKKLVKYICAHKCGSDSPELNDFGKRQFDLLVEIIQTINSKIILVANALASKIFKNELSSSLKWKEEIGTYVLTMNINCPVFFSGMISGQRALDLFSKERLIWHMKKVLHG
ncbi:hypothetical protein [Mesoaciditoga lauensis]|uniref:hypothetical protein n=1 Tax=Mesoaciditoga lauensis TaxID=1495039 RepID=UPI000567D0EA|nr:hypothetical protein [Mesoaciditoga lauensis]